MKCIDNLFEHDENKREKARQLKTLYDKYKNNPRMMPNNKSKLNKNQYDAILDIWIKPTKLIEDVIARQNSYLSALIDIFGTAVISLTKPLVGKAHKELKNRSAFYRDTISMIRNGFADSQLAEKMWETLGIAGDVDQQRIAQLMQLSESIMQKSNFYLSNILPDLDEEIHITYPKKEDRVRLYKIVARTGLAGISTMPNIAKEFIDGDMSLKEALDTARKEVNVLPLEEDIINDLATYYLEGTSSLGFTNPRSAGLIDPRYEAVIALTALSRIEGSEKMIKEMKPSLKKDIYGILQSIYAQNKEINLRQSDTDGATLDPYKGEYKVDYDGHLMKDIHEAIYEYKIVNEYDLQKGKYTEADDWKVIIKPDTSKNIIGVVAREKIDASSTPGVGLNNDRFNNGFYIDESDSNKLLVFMNKMSNSEKYDFLIKNNLVRVGKRFRLKIPEKVKVEKLRLKQSAAHSLIRTFVHNKELIEMQAIRDIVTESATQIITNEKELKELEKTIILNSKKPYDKQEVLPMFLKLDMNYDSYESLPKWIKRKYIPPTNLSTMNRFNEKITLVRTSLSDELLGHPNYSLFGNKGPRSLSKLEKLYKELIVMAKTKMVITNPKKLVADTISNIAILGIKDVNIFNIKRGFTEGLSQFRSFNLLRSKLVEEELKIRMGDKNATKRAEFLKEKIKTHPFYYAYKAGFIQSFSTNLVVKEFDTLSGLQATIDKVVDSITKDSNGNPNEVFKAIKKWQELGSKFNLNIDVLLNKASEFSKLKGTGISTEMKNIANRLEKHRKDPESVARYINELIGGPSSEMMRAGGSVMVTVDVLSKYTLATTLLGDISEDATKSDIDYLQRLEDKILNEKNASKKKSLKEEYYAFSTKLYPNARINPKTKRRYTKEEAYREANNTFIDYRRNLPREIKTLSDYGILMFPNFWLKAQKVIVNMFHYHPASAISSYILTDALNADNINFMHSNIISKLSDGTIINDPTNIVSWNTFSPFIGLL